MDGGIGGSDFMLTYMDGEPALLDYREKAALIDTRLPQSPGAVVSMWGHIYTLHIVMARAVYACDSSGIG